MKHPRTNVARIFALACLAPAFSATAHADVVNGRIQGPYDQRPGVALPQDGQTTYAPGAPSTGVQTNIGTPGTGSADGPRPHVTKQPSEFIHPVRKFKLTIPAGVAVYQRGEEKHLAMRSPTGYILNVQTGDSNKDIPLTSMLARLEQRYLGDQGPWQRKLKWEPGSIAGMEALTAEYQGHHARTRVMIARGAKTDFVFTFLSPNDLFVEQQRTFQWVLDNFAPAANEVVQTAQAAAPAGPTPTSQQLMTQPVRAADSVASLATGRPSERKAGAAPSDMQRFLEPGFGFMIDYPNGWNMTKPTAFTATFSGPEGTPAYDAVVAVQNIRPTAGGNGEKSATSAAADLLASLSKTTQGMKIIAEGNLAESPGSQFIAKYSFSGKSYRKWAVVVPRPEGDIAHVWSYTAPDNQFDRFQPVAQSMLRSWTLTR